jgi:uncharacterized protein YgiM (DUF1202 family)
VVLRTVDRGGRTAGRFLHRGETHLSGIHVVWRRGAAASLALAVVVGGGAPPAAAATGLQQPAAAAGALAPGATGGSGLGAAAALSPATAAPASSRPASVPAAAAVKYAKTTANLHLRKGPGTRHASLGLMKKGTVVARTGKVSGAWWQVTYGGKTGWASTTYLRSTTAPATPQTPARKATDRWFGGSQALYTKPTFASKRLQAHTKGTKATLLRSSGTWSYVQAPSGKGWLPTADLSKTATRYTGATILPSSDYRWTRHRSNVRVGGSTSTRSLGVVPAGEMMPLLQVRNGWSKVKTSRGTGWIKNTLLTNLATNAPAHLQPVTAKLLKNVEARYAGSYSSAGTIRNGSIGHRLGLGVDYMIKGWSTSAGIRKGDALAAYLVKNHRALDVDYVIWRDRIWLSQDGQWGPYSKGGWGRHLDSRGWNATTLHHDHIHVDTLVD